MTKEQILYQEKFKKGSAMVNEDLLPIIRHVGFDDVTVESAELKEASVVEIGGRQYISHTIRVLMPRDSNTG